MFAIYVKKYPRDGINGGERTWTPIVLSLSLFPPLSVCSNISPKSHPEKNSSQTRRGSKLLEGTIDLKMCARFSCDQNDFPIKEERLHRESRVSPREKSFRRSETRDKRDNQRAFLAHQVRAYAIVACNINHKLLGVYLAAF